MFQPVKLDRLHFKHTVTSDYCELKDGGLTAQEADIHKKILIAKESPRHIALPLHLYLPLKKFIGFAQQLYQRVKLLFAHART